MKSYRCHINIPGFKRMGTGKLKVWRTDNIVVSYIPVYFFGSEPLNLIIMNRIRDMLGKEIFRR